MNTSFNAGGYTIECLIENNELIITGFSGQDSRLIVPDCISVGEKSLKVVKVAKKAFMGANLLKHISLPSSLTIFEDWCFAQCTHLISLVIREDSNTNILDNLSFGKGVFEGCDSLEYICAGYEEPDSFAFLLGALINKLPATYLLRDPDIGKPSWFSMWDKSLITYLSEKDDAGYTDRVLCGEEDISYDDIGSIDGEMPGENLNYIIEIHKRKCSLCFLRLMHNIYLDDNTKELLINYLKASGKGKGREESWLVLKEKYADKLDYLEMYANIGAIDTNLIDEMLDDLGQSHAEAKAFLIKFKQDNCSGNDFFSDLML